ncbi:hypothetical protein FBU30_000463 [Linnemannia zychae]|nr:hypothetical protein FBU30_000463 [Linnemannia zychae]
MYGQTYKQKSVLETYIERACDPSRFEPDLALNMEICDVIKEKQKNTPREAAIYIVRLVNHKNMHVGMLALTLLDNCVKNCGYPFHLQIATKEFLNALVRKFPERPLTVPTPVQTRILEMIQEWYTTLCKTSRYKEDLIHIRDMHRLLAFKGYRFPPVKKSATAVLNSVDSLKSSAQLEEEDRAAQAAEQEEKPDYAEQASAELDKIFSKATMLIEMLNEVKPGEIIGRGDIFEDIYGTCNAAQPKIQKFINDNEDPDNMHKLLELNDVLNNVIEQYKEVKAGNLIKMPIPSSDDTVNNDQRGSQAPSTPKQNSSLIDLVDFDESSDGSPSGAVTPKTTGNLMDDLMNLSFNDTPPPPSWGASGSISLGQSQNKPSSPTTPTSGGPAYNVFSAPVTGVNVVSVGSSSSTATSLSPQQKSSAKPVQVASLIDDFDFVSNTGAPEPSGPTQVILLNKDGFQIDLDIQKSSEPHGSVYNITAYFSNQLNSSLSELTFRVAVPKTLNLKLDPQSAQVVPPFSKKTVTQSMTIRVPAEISVVRMRYHVSYVHGGKTIEDQGEFNQFP